MVTGCAENRIAAEHTRGIMITSACAVADINAYILCFIKCMHFMFLKNIHIIAYKKSRFMIGFVSLNTAILCLDWR